MKKDKTIGEEKQVLTPLNNIIQVCPVCSKIDVYKNDGHCCASEIEKRNLNER